MCGFGGGLAVGGGERVNLCCGEAVPLEGLEVGR